MTPPTTTTSSSWDSTLRGAKNLETRLETSIRKYVALAQKINADYLCDEESLLMTDTKNTSNEQELSTSIEHDIKKLAEAIDMMRTIRNASKNSQNHESIIKRYHEVHSEYYNEYRKAHSTIKQKRDSNELFKNAKSSNARSDGEDSLMTRLLREKGGLGASIRGINEIISQAFETKSNLQSQRSSLQHSSGGITGLVANVPSLQRLIDGVQRKKIRETMIVATFIGVLLCFTIWWLFLR